MADDFDGDVYAIRVATVYHSAGGSEFAVEATSMAEACSQAIALFAKLEEREPDECRAMKAEVTNFRGVIKQVPPASAPETSSGLARQIDKAKAYLDETPAYAKGTQETGVTDANDG